MRTLLFIIPVLFTTILFSCSNNHHPEKVKTLDSLNVALEEALTELLTFDSSTVALHSDTLNAIQQSLKEYKPDTLMKPEGEALARFVQVKTPYDIYNKKKGQFVEDILYTRDQLSTLSHDLSKGLVPEENIEKFFGIEKNKAEQLLSGSMIISKGLDNAIKTYDSAIDSIRGLRQRFIFISDSISKHK